jgi:hypothetical protein
MKKILRIAYWQPVLVERVKTTNPGTLLFQDYSAVAVGQVVAEDDDVVCLALVATAHMQESIVVIPQRSIIDCEVLNA